MLINKHREQKEIIKRARRKRNRSYLSQLALNPELFKRQLAEIFQTIRNRISA
ncbi:Uncharacterised protein [Pseudomonas putida]|nr:Uncharacterised protein [Pseudomonas putida]